MKVQKSWLLACVAGTCATTAAMAQSVEVQAEPMGTSMRVDAATGQVLGPVYSERVPGSVWDNYIFNGTTGAGGSSLGNITHNVLFKINWAPGPWASQVTHSLTGINILMRHFQVPDTQCNVEVRFYNIADVNLAGFNGMGTSMINPGPDALPNTPDDAQPVGQRNLALPLIPPSANLNGFQYVLGTPLDLPAGEYFVNAKVVDATTGLQLTLADDRWRICSGTTSGAAAPATNPCIVGTGMSDQGYDADSNGWFAGAVVPAATGERRAFGLNPAPVRPITTGFGFVGEISGTAPTCGVQAENLALGSDNVFVSDSETLAGGAAKIYCVTLPSDAIDASLKYIDIDTEGSTGDVMIAVYDADGNLAATDNGSGSGTNDQLSFGIGRRAAVADGLQYDGRNWNDGPAVPVLGLSAGTNYIYVAPVGTTFATGFSVTPGATGGDFTLRVRTNAGSGTLAPSVAPLATRLTGLGGEDPIIAPGAQTALIPLDGPGVLWYDVNLCEPSSASAAISFDLVGTTAPTHTAFLFDAAGNLLNSANGTPATPAVMTYTDAPSLPAGHYYIAMTYQAPIDLSPDPASNGRWHVRGRNASGLAFQLTVGVSNSGCAAACDPDFNCDGNPDQDDVACIINVVAGNPGCECQDPDFNHDGNVDQDDVAALINVVAGGNCP